MREALLRVSTAARSRIFAHTADRTICAGHAAGCSAPSSHHAIGQQTPIGNQCDTREQNACWLGPALGEQDLRISDDLSQTALDVPLLSRPSVRGVPQLHGWTTLVERRPTIYFRAEISNVAEQERYNKDQGQNLQVSLRLGQ